MKHVLSIAGSDSGGCAGIQADLKTMCALGVYGMTAITAITVQNTQGVRAVQEIDPEIVSGQIEAIFDDIEVDAVKVGMVANTNVARAIREALAGKKVNNLVVDPVMVSKNGSRLFSDEAVREIMHLVSMSTIATPNLFEAELLSGIPIRNHSDMRDAAWKIREKGAGNLIIKGGRLEGDADDFLLIGNDEVWLNCPRIKTKNTNGTGCSLSTAIACFLAKGQDLSQATANAKDYITQAIRDSLDIGHGNGPLGHLIHLYQQAKI